MSLNFTIGQPLHEGSNLFVVGSRGELAPVGAPATPLGSGATGMVVRVLQDQRIPRAVKILDPEPKLVARLGIAPLRDAIRREGDKLAALTHSHLSKILWAGEMPAPARGRGSRRKADTVPYLVMEFVDGMRLHDFIRDQLDVSQPQRAVTVVVDLLTHVLSALGYLHRRSAMHADVKEDNVIVRYQDLDEPEAVLVDLGCAHIFSGQRSAKTHFFSTPTRLEHRWAALIGEEVDAETLAANRHFVDLDMFGKMLQALLSAPGPRDGPHDWQEGTTQKLKDVFGEFDTLLRVARRCVDGEYTAAKDVTRDLQFLRPTTVNPLGIPELSLGSDDSKTSLSLPQARVFITRRLHSVISHPGMQRLRDINQLDLLRMVYPGATQTRFLHSVDTYETARHYVGSLLSDPTFRGFASNSSIEGILLSALFHDAGHYPLEHVLEDFAQARDDTGPYATVMTDDEVVAAIFGVGSRASDEAVRMIAADFTQDAGRETRRKWPSLPELVAERFSPATLARVQAFLGTSPPTDPATRMFRTIIDGPIDADKVSYLRMDAQTTGAKYGRGIDVDSLLGSLTGIVTDSVAEIGVIEKGVTAAEAVATTRRWMFQRVYWHHTNRAVMAMLRYPLQYLFETDHLTFEEYFAASYGRSDTETIRWVDERLTSVLGADASVENPAKGVLPGRRQIYKRLISFRHASDDKTVNHARDALLRRPPKEWLSICRRLAEALREIHPSLKDSDILIDVPVKSRPQLGEVRVLMPNGRLEKLSTVSEEFRNARLFFEQASLVSRVFVHPAVREELIAANKFEDARTVVINELARRAT